jgi:ankyrin repeat protein
MKTHLKTTRDRRSLPSLKAWIGIAWFAFLQPITAMLPGDEYTFRRKVSPQEDLNCKFWNLIEEGHKKGSLEKIEKVVAAGCDINSYQYGNTALTYSAHRGPKRVYELLIMLKADVNLPNKETGDTPLLIAFKATHYKLCELLIASGAHVNAKNNRDESLVLYTASNGHLELTELLLTHGADINAKSKDEWTPLLLAARNSNERICRLLLKRGASPITRDADGRTPLIHAAQNRNIELCTHLLVGHSKAIKTCIITLLSCLKSLGPQNAQLRFLYKEREHLWRPAFKKIIITPQELLNAQDNFGQTAYDYWAMPLLKPVECEKK